LKKFTIYGAKFPQNDFNNSEQSTQHHVDLKIEEIKGEMKFLQGMIE
jgi:hypothetical protein